MSQNQSTSTNGTTESSNEHFNFNISILKYDNLMYLEQKLKEIKQ